MERAAWFLTKVCFTYEYKCKCFSDVRERNWSVISWIYFSEISRDTESTFKKMIKEVSKAPAPKQIGIGAAAGWMSGYVMMKVGKAAATGKQTF